MFVSYSQDSGPLKELSHEYYPVFRSIFFIAFFFTLYGCNLFIWRRAKIEYRSVMEVSKFHTYQYVLRGASSTAYIVFCCFMMYILTLTGGLEGIYITKSDKHIFPMLAFVLPSILFFCPYDHWTELCYGVTSRGYNQRIGMLKQIIAVLCSPFSKVTFIRTFIADILCSMPRIFTDFQYTLCIYITGLYWDEENEWQNETQMHAYDTCGGGSISYMWFVDVYIS
jgi:hypothetical protein